MMRTFIRMGQGAAIVACLSCSGDRSRDRAAEKAAIQLAEQAAEDFCRVVELNRAARRELDAADGGR